MNNEIENIGEFIQAFDILDDPRAENAVIMPEQTEEQAAIEDFDYITDIRVEETHLDDDLYQ